MAAVLPLSPRSHAPGFYYPESPLSSCSLSSTVWVLGGERGVVQSGKGRTPLGLPPEKTHVAEGGAGPGARAAHDRRGEDAGGRPTAPHSAGG